MVHSIVLKPSETGCLSSVYPQCPEPGCAWAFTTAYKLKRHEESHGGKKEYICDIVGCGRKFTTVYNLNSHRKLHTRPCTEECPQPGCGQRFPTKKQLDYHMKEHGPGQKTYCCPHAGCDMKFYSPFCMGSHARVHQRTRDLTCKVEGCGRKFDKQCRLKQHMRSHTGERPYICSIEGCGWAFSSSSKLKRHLHKHTGNRQWMCPEPGCGKAFMRSEHLKGHMITHTGQRPFACPIEGCNSRFTAKSSLYVHERKHLNSKLHKIIYFCPLDSCDKRYTSKNALRSHLAKHVQNQYNNTLVPSDLNLIPILNAEDYQTGLDSFSQEQSDAVSTVTSAAHSTVANVLLTPDGSAVINPADLMTSEEQPVNVDGTSLLDVMSQSGVLFSGQGTVPSWIDTSATRSVGIRVKTEIVAATERVKPEGTGGAARTDYHSNCMLSDRAKKRRKTRKELTDMQQDSMSKLGSTNIDVSDSGKLGLGSTSPVCSSCAPVINPNEIMTSRAITFRDPETGAIYVQTQLLQDDPPDPEVYSDDASLDTTDQSALCTTDFSRILQDSHGSCADMTEFTGTTINLQDLE
ncbi:hypothetical protein NP493_1608g00035 [Ridgeia piscesae]|uniref:C2H2-type domain-containing protein n=1 Tax=Ridgeia piscesae TaxID=27915 RepID=A0AAD9JX55_RIDPI|nr:hypothetical protein NP493_1608g00035 [Ridgeia piscesae]